MELTGLHHSHAYFLSFSCLISREYLKKSARSVVRDDVLGKFLLAIVGFQFQRYLPVVICFKVATGWHCVVNGKMLLLSFCICRRASFRWFKVNFWKCFFCFLFFFSFFGESPLGNFTFGGFSGNFWCSLQWMSLKSLCSIAFPFLRAFVSLKIVLSIKIKGVFLQS